MLRSRNHRKRVYGLCSGKWELDTDQPWYKGAHKPLITKELFDKVQETRHVWKGVWGSKDFIFKGKFRCGKCGTLIIGQEKYKKQKDGSFKRHVYYTCTGRTKRSCKQPYIREVDLCVILGDFVNTNYKKLQLSDDLTKIVAQHEEANKVLLKHYDMQQGLENPIVEYSRYIFTGGSDEEKSRFVNGIMNNLSVRNLSISIVKEMPS